MTDVDGRSDTPVSADDLDLPFLDLGRGASHEERIADVAEARAHGWLARTSLGYAIVTYEDVYAIHRDRRFHNGIQDVFRATGITDERFLARRPNPFLRSEGARHSHLRRLVSAAMTPKAIDQLRPFMQRTLSELVEPIRSAGGGDLVGAVFDPYPVAVICEMIGAPPEDWQLFSNWVRDIFAVYGARSTDNLTRILEAHDELDAYVTAMVDERRGRPRADLLSKLIHDEESDDEVSTEDLRNIIESFLLAGTDTTRNQLGLTFATILGDDRVRMALRDDATRIPAAVDESLRYLATAQGQPRVVPEDTVYRGVLFRAGTLLQTSFLGANFDPSVWHDAAAFDIERATPPHGHLTFGTGTHFCLGAHLARAELEEALAVVLHEMPDVHLKGTPQFRPFGGGGMFGLDRLDVDLASQA